MVAVEVVGADAGHVGGKASVDAGAAVQADRRRQRGAIVNIDLAQGADETLGRGQVGGGGVEWSLGACSFRSLCPQKWQPNI